jgi:hypothetical protein
MLKGFRLLGSGLIAGSGFLAAHPASALNGPSNIEIDGGPLGPLEISAGMDGYMYYQSGTADNEYKSNSLAGDKSTGANLNAAMIQLKKNTGPVQFTFQLAAYQAFTLGAGLPKEASITHFTLGPVRTAYVTIPLSNDFKISAGQLASLEAYESTFPWNNPTGMNTILYYVTNSSSRGVQAEYTHDPVDVTLLYGDGTDSGVFNYLQFLGTYTFNSNNNVNVYGGVRFGTVGPNAYAYGQDYVADGNELATNFNVFGAWYSTTQGNLTLIPQAQYAYANPNHHYANYGPSAVIPNYTSNFAASVLFDYAFGTSPYSLGGWVEYADSHGDTAQNYWFTAPNAELVGFSLAPTWQHKNIYARVNAGYVHLLNGSFTNDGTTGAYGNSGHGKDQFVGLLEGGVVF